MTSDADSRPDAATPDDAADGAGPEDAGPAAGAEVTNDDAEADDVTEVAAKGRPSVFILLTCGFLACMCCVGGTFAGGSLAWMRMSNLDTTRDEIGGPPGWTMSESPSATPWRAEATWSGPSNAQEVTEWLLDEGAKVAEDDIAKCLSSGDTCTVKFKSGGFPVKVKYGSGGKQAHVTVLVD